ncbi:MAG: hypothetical protein PHE53_03205 [Thermoguttaceae bacterium]|nr:hypothetical protein [Thermoguttaceae bacterium]
MPIEKFRKFERKPETLEKSAARWLSENCENEASKFKTGGGRLISKRKKYEAMPYLNGKISACVLESCSTHVLQQALNDLDEAERIRLEANRIAEQTEANALTEADEMIQKAKNDVDDIIAEAEAEAKAAANDVIANVKDKEEIIKERAFQYLYHFLNDRNN